MKRIAVILAVLAGLCAPAVAEAHHVAGGSATCSLVNNVPTIKATASFVSFDNSNKPINGRLLVDNKLVQTVSNFTFYGSNGTWTSNNIATTPGTHYVNGVFTWPYQNGENGSFSASVTCPAPPQPTPTPTPSPTPTPTPPVTPPAPPAPPTVPPVPPAPPTPPSPPVTPPKHCPDTSNKRYHITVVPRHASHGLVHFRLHGPHIRHARWYVDMHRRHNARFENISNHTKQYNVWLFEQSVFGKNLWGWHWITVQAAVGPPGCGHTASVRLHFFNNDPLL